MTSSTSTAPPSSPPEAPRPGQRFASIAQARAALAPVLDRPEAPRRRTLAPGLTFSAAVAWLGEGRFSNVYTLAWEPERVGARLAALDPPSSVGAWLQATPELCAASTGSFFFLADHCLTRPQTLNLNLCIADGRVRSLPVVDQEALLACDGRLKVRTVRAQGRLRLGERVVTWAGSRAAQARHAQACVYGNANVVIDHLPHPRTGRARTLDPGSCLTPPILAGDRVDLGLRARADGDAFEVARVEPRGGLDLFAYDVVLRVPAGWAQLGTSAEVLTLDGLAVGKAGEALEGAVSTGPDLNHGALDRHPLNRERCLGSTPLLSGVRAARLLFCVAPDGLHRLVMWDARPSSPRLVGVTMDEAVAWARGAFGAPLRGCFLDSGNTSRLAVRDGQGGSGCWGNRHYLRWPERDGEPFVWIPDEGRRTASAIGLWVQP